MWVYVISKLLICWICLLVVYDLECWGWLVFVFWLDLLVLWWGEGWGSWCFWNGFCGGVDVGSVLICDCGLFCIGGVSNEWYD